MRLLAPAKINLHLRVYGVQSDGFHPLLSWMCTVGLFDTLEIDHTQIDQTANGIAVSCDDASIPCDARNLVYRAAELMLKHWERAPGHSPRICGECRGVRVHLCKAHSRRRRPWRRKLRRGADVTWRQSSFEHGPDD